MRKYPDMGLPSPLSQSMVPPVLNYSVTMSGQTDDIINCLITNFHEWVGRPENLYSIITKHFILYKISSLLYSYRLPRMTVPTISSVK